MNTRRATLFALVAAALLAGCGTSESPNSRTAAVVTPATGEDIQAYAGGTAHAMRITHVNLSPNATDIASAETLYVAIYPLNQDGRRDLGALSLGTGYHPQCDPCFHPGLPAPLVYHDHIFAGTLGSESAGAQIWVASNRHPIAVMYDPAWIARPDFRPLRTADEIKAAETSGHLLPINKSAANPFEMPQDTVVTVELQTFSR